jgi:hypothetical protein
VHGLPTIPTRELQRPEGLRCDSCRASSAISAVPAIRRSSPPSLPSRCPGAPNLPPGVEEVFAALSRRGQLMPANDLAWPRRRSSSSTASSSARKTKRTFAAWMGSAWW